MQLNHNQENSIRPITRNTYKVLKLHTKESSDNLNEFYTSSDYHSRLSAIKNLAMLSGGLVPSYIMLDAMKDPCSMIREFAVENFDYKKVTAEIEMELARLAKEDEKVQMRMLALEKLSEIDTQAHYDLFFNSSLLKNAKEAAAGLKALAKLDIEKAYKVAKFRAETSKSDLDIAITEVFAQVGDIKDLPYCKRYCGERQNFYKTRYIPSYLRMLIKVGNARVFKHHLDFMADDVKFSEKETLLPIFITQLQALARDLNKGDFDLAMLKRELLPFVNDLIDQLLENKERVPEILK
ncbi:hypothetical protein [Daejeonella lutea]|uniref:HEAT repeat-containing protein n=1 Tax=Daejeonella lutea TaxID=572036 RepID=A0A1T5BTS7_9SPHI|nr:hypothetical protein [Daejeonella lutea]SKB50519.1 hypothetical protein SAMN05661099_1674 [Daejeonella lutea]